MHLPVEVGRDGVKSQMRPRTSRNPSASFSGRMRRSTDVDHADAKSAYGVASGNSQLAPVPRVVGLAAARGPRAAAKESARHLAAPSTNPSSSPPLVTNEKEFSIDEARAVLRILCDPTQSLLEHVQRYETTLKTFGLSSLSQEVCFAPGVSLHRESFSYSTYQYIARIQLANMYHVARAQHELQANMRVANDLVQSVEHFVHQWNEKWREIRRCFGENGNEKNYQKMFQQLQRRGIVQRWRGDDLDGDNGISFAGVLNLPLAQSGHPYPDEAATRAANELMVFLGELVKLGTSPPVVPPAVPFVQPNEVQTHGHPSPQSASCLDMGVVDEPPISRHNTHQRETSVSPSMPVSRRPPPFASFFSSGNMSPSKEEVSCFLPRRRIKTTGLEQKQRNGTRMNGVGSKHRGGISSANIGLAGLFASVGQYDMDSEKDHSDHARFRAAVRGLLNHSNSDICNHLKQLGCFSTYRGAVQQHIASNFKLSLSSKRLEEGFFRVTVAVNDVIHYRGEARNKREAIAAASTGTVELLKRIRGLWDLLVSFMSEKLAQTHNAIESFDALHQSRIASFTFSTGEDRSIGSSGRRYHSPIEVGKVPCVAKINEYAVFRGTAASEADAEALAIVQCVHFLKNLTLIEKRRKESKTFKICELNSNPTVPRAKFYCTIALKSAFGVPEMNSFQVSGYWCLGESTSPHASTPPTSEEFSTDDPVLSQVASVQMKSVGNERQEPESMEKRFRTIHSSDVVFCVESPPYQPARFVKALTDYCDKRPSMARVPQLRSNQACAYDIYLIPPGASINSEKKKFYWPSFMNQFGNTDWKKVYGILRKQL